MGWRRALFRCFLTAAVFLAFTAASAAQTAPEAAKPAPKPQPLKVAFFQLDAQGVEAKVSSIVTDMLLLEMSKMKDARVIGSKEVDAMLGYEQKKQMAGCTDTSCMVAIGGALGVDKILMGSVGKLGSSYTVNLKLINIREGNIEQMYGKRLKGGNEEEFLDIIPEALAFIFPSSAYVWAKDRAPVPVDVVDLQRTPSQVKIPGQPDERRGATQTPQAASAPVPAPAGETSTGQAGKPEPAVVKAEATPATPKPEGPYPHNSQFFLGAKGILQVQYLTYAGEVHLGYGLADWVELGAAVVVSKDLGVKPRATFFVHNADGAVKPYVGVQVPYYSGAGGAVLSAGAAPGVQWDFHKMAGLTVEFAAEYVVVKPKSSALDPLNLMALLGAQFRL
ncbi:MAG: hypothetical protein HY897_05430 [Deltaproteobacteria bacterium]|nr:hypothetical protein [Deltaproteobacteria bacterium]